jgi:hypothetical protein
MVITRLTFLEEKFAKDFNKKNKKIFLIYFLYAFYKKAKRSFFMEHTRQVNIIESKFVGKCYSFHCPHCDGMIYVMAHEVACRIFRHGVYSQGPNSGEPINPHESKINIDKLVDEGKIRGCGKPIQMTEDYKQVKTCDYI